MSDAPRAEVVVVMVATPEQLAELVSQMTDAVQEQLWIIMSTVGPDSVREQGNRLRQVGARVVDAPVTGGVARAKTGELTIFVAGTSMDVEAAKPVLDAMGTVRATGVDLGDGQSIKVVNQHTTPGNEDFGNDVIDDENAGCHDRFFRNPSMVWRKLTTEIGFEM